jgi:hypothetical protein
VGGGVFAGFDEVVSGSDNAAVRVNDDAAYRDFARGFGGFGLFNSQQHVIFVFHGKHFTKIRNGKFATIKD